MNFYLKVYHSCLLMFTEGGGGGRNLIKKKKFLLPENAAPLSKNSKTKL
jgi:hypothetical protein